MVVSFGLINAPAVFQTFINDLLRDFLNSSVFLDDIIIFLLKIHWGFIQGFIIGLTGIEMEPIGARQTPSSGKLSHTYLTAGASEVLGLSKARTPLLTPLQP